ncbi:MAG TPA: peptidoglycan-binding protein [Clostridia bacterium]|nr:peptidoglycan-binding protein [Clostridia bacterium]
MNIISKDIYEEAEKNLLEAKEAVAWVQSRLNINGYSLDVDGVWGSKTEDMVRLFQKNEGLVVDGIVGKNTRQALESEGQSGTSHFKDDEFKCNCPGWCNGLPSKGVSQAFIARLEKVRSEVNSFFPGGSGQERVLIINSGYRCERWNKHVGGALKSQHTISNPLACADIRSPGITPKALGEICDRIFHDGGVGLGGKNIVHVDSRGQKARWWYNT